jgi:hypothetical protein
VEQELDVGHHSFPVPERALDHKNQKAEVEVAEVMTLVLVAEVSSYNQWAEAWALELILMIRIMKILTMTSLPPLLETQIFLEIPPDNLLFLVPPTVVLWSEGLQLLPTRLPGPITLPTSKKQPPRNNSNSLRERIHGHIRDGSNLVVFWFRLQSRRSLV